MKNLINSICFLVGLQALAATAKPTAVTLALNWKAETEFGGLYAASL